MKKIIASVIILGALACYQSHAQTLEAFKKMPAEQKAKLVSDSLKKILVFTGDQYSRVYPIVFEIINHAKPIIQSDDSRFSKRKNLQQLLATEEAKLQKVFTSEQFILYQIKKQKMIAYYRSHWQSPVILFTIPE